MEIGKQTWNGNFVWLPEERYPNLQKTYGTVAGTNVTMHLSEIEGKIDSTMSYVMRNGSQEYETWNLSSVRYLTVTVSNMTAPVLLQEICLRASFYPVAEEGTFNCSDRLLNQIYDAGKYTLKICQQDYHLDSPIHQEALGCTGD